LSLIPEWFYEGSKLFKSKKHGFPPPRHPGNLQAGVHSIEKPKKKKKFGFPIKDFGNDERGGATPE